MFIKCFTTALLAASGLMAGATVSAADLAVTTPPPPPPPEVQIGDYATPERPGSAQFTIPCLGSTACDSLARWCTDHGGTFTDWTDRSGETKGLCSG